MDSVIKFFSAMILAFVVFINSIGNFFGIGDLIPTQPEVPPTTAVIGEGTTVPEETTIPEETTVQKPTEPATTEAVEPTKPVEDNAQRVVIGGKYVCFGWDEQQITAVLGETEDVVYEVTKDGRQLLSLVYASDYSKLAVFQLVDDVFSGFYTVDTAAVVTDGTNEYSIASSGVTSQSKLSIKEYKDSHQDNIVYAIYVSYNGFSVKAKDLIDQNGQVALNFYVTNALRAINGVYAYEYSDKATAAIKLHCEDMAARDYFDHYSPEGESVADRLHAQGVNYRACAENIAAGSSGNAFSFADAWYNSHAGHREGMLSTDYDYIGIAVVVNADGSTTYAGQNFYRNM